jgi:hypothetical protein
MSARTSAMERAFVCSKPSSKRQNASSADRPLAKLERSSFLVRQFCRSRPLKNDDGPVQEAFKTSRPQSDATEKVVDV